MGSILKTMRASRLCVSHNSSKRMQNCKLLDLLSARHIRIKACGIADVVIYLQICQQDLLVRCKVRDRDRGQRPCALGRRMQVGKSCNQLLQADIRLPGLLQKKHCGTRKANEEKHGRTCEMLSLTATAHLIGASTYKIRSMGSSERQGGSHWGRLW